jgi:O-antigen/teichoic acid export membrane protein
VQHTLATGRAATLIKLAFAAGAKLSAAFIAFGLTALVTRNMPNDEAGLFLLGFSILAVLSIFFRLGLDNVILRFLSAHGTDAFAQEKLNRGLLWVATVVIPSTALGMFFSEQIATHIFNKPAFGPVLFWMLLALPAMAIFMLLAMAFQAQHRVIITTIFQNLGISTIFVVAFGYLWVEQPEVLNAVTAAQIYAGAAGVIFLAALVTWFSQKGISFNVTSYKDKELTSASANLWVASNMSLITMWSGVLIAGAMVSSQDLAQLSAAQRTASLVSFVIVVVNMVVAPRYAKLWREGELDKIRALAKWSTRAMLLAVIPLVIMIVFFNENIMSIFGSGYFMAGSLLIYMSLGHLFNVATGSVGYLLNMSGHERDFRLVSLVSGPIVIIMTMILTYSYGVAGAAISTGVGIALQNIAAYLMVKIRLGFFPGF